MNNDKSVEVNVEEVEQTEADEQLTVEVPIELRAGYCTCRCATREVLV